MVGREVEAGLRGLWGAQGRQMSRSLFVGLREKELWSGGAIAM